MSSYNKVVVIGKLTRDVELNYTSSQTAVTDIGLAINDKVKRNDQWVDEVTFIDITLWGRTAEVAAEFLKKGSQVLIEGRLRMETWLDKKNGNAKRTKIKLTGETMRMLGSKPKSEDTDAAPNAESVPVGAAAAGEEVPF